MKRDKSDIQFTVLVPPSTHDRIMRFQERLSEKVEMPISKAVAMRKLLELGLDVVERQEP